MTPRSLGPSASVSVLICGLIARDEAALAESEKLLVERFGPVAERGAVIPFDFTDYYEPEMGKNLIRRWLGFSRLVPSDSLTRTKLATIALEHQLASSAVGEDSRSAIADRRSKIEDRRSSVRRANLDPGLLSLHNFVLASTKDFAHRIYLGSGIHAELTLIYKSGRFESLPWTYPDYRTPACLDFLVRCRALLKT